MINQVIQGDCYELMKGIPDGNIDAVISDFPYNTTQAAWDKQPIDLPLLWKEFGRIVKPNGAIITTASQPFTTVLIASNYKWFRYEWIWVRSKISGHLGAKRRPLKGHESVVVFSKEATNYYPQMKKGIIHDRTPRAARKRPNETYGKFKDGLSDNLITDLYYPKSVLEFQSVMVPTHPNEKPLSLFDYLTRTYTNPGETILDPFSGSGTTAIAAHNTGRNFICFEKEKKYVDIANKRLEQVKQQPRFDEMAG